MQQERQNEKCKSCRSNKSPSTLRLVCIVGSSWPFKSKASQMSPEGATWPLEVNKREEKGSDRNCLGCFLWELAGCWMMVLPEARLRVRIALWFFKFKLVLMKTFFLTIIKVIFFVSIPTGCLLSPFISLPEVQIPKVLFSLWCLASPKLGQGFPLQSSSGSPEGWCERLKLV